MVPKIGPQVNSMMDHQDHTWTLNIKASKNVLDWEAFKTKIATKLLKKSVSFLTPLPRMI